MPGNESPCGRARHQLSCPPLRPTLHIFHGRSVLVQDTTTTVHLCRARQALGGGDVVERGCRCRLLCGAQHERTRLHPRGHGGVSRRRRSTSSVAWTLRSRLPAVANSADGAALRDGTNYTSEIAAAVTVTKHCGVSVLRNNQPSTNL